MSHCKKKILHLLLVSYNLLFLNFQFSVTQTVTWNMMLSMEMASSQEPALFQSRLMHIIFRTYLSMGIMQIPPSKRQINLISLQEVHALVLSLFCQPSLLSWRQVRVTWPTAILIHDGMYTSPSPQPKFFHDRMVMSPASKGLMLVFFMALLVLFVS